CARRGRRPLALPPRPSTRRRWRPRSTRPSPSPAPRPRAGRAPSWWCKTAASSPSATPPVTAWIRRRPGGPWPRRAATTWSGCGGGGRPGLEEPLRVPEGATAGDPRGAITLRQALQMSSGLQFSEAYGNPLGDVLWMLFGTGDAARFAAGKPLAAPPGTQWSYASGTTNIIARALRRAVGGGDQDYRPFPP